MIHQKKLRWDCQKQELENKIKIRDQETLSQQIAIEQKSIEVI
jgi:hypothetical protein